MAGIRSQKTNSGQHNPGLVLPIPPHLKDSPAQSGDSLLFNDKTDGRGGQGLGLLPLFIIMSI